MTLAKADQGKSESRPYAHTGTAMGRNFHRVPATEIRERLIAVGWIGSPAGKIQTNDGDRQ